MDPMERLRMMKEDIRSSIGDLLNVSDDPYQEEVLRIMLELSNNLKVKNSVVEYSRRLNEEEEGLEDG